MEWLIDAVKENFSAILSGFFVIIGTFFGWFLNQLTIMRQDRPQLAFVAEGTPNEELTEPELRTKTSSSEWSIRIYNIGRTAYFLESFIIMRKGHTLVECYDVCCDNGAIAPNSSILYTLMQQDASALQLNYSECYKKPSRIYQYTVHLLMKIPTIQNHIIDPLFKQGECKVIAYSISGKKIYGKIDLPLLYIRHTARDTITGK